MSTVHCLDCHQPIQPNSVFVEGELVSCPHCGAELEVINAEPVELDWVFLEPSPRGKDRGSWMESAD